MSHCRLPSTIRIPPSTIRVSWEGPSLRDEGGEVAGG